MVNDAPASMLNRLAWLLSEDCELVGGVKPALNVNCPSVGAMHRKMRSAKTPTHKIV